MAAFLVLQTVTVKMNYFINYLHQGGYVFVVVCLSVSNFAQKLWNGFV